MPEVKFQVGQVYANRDGQYEVLSVDPGGGRMEVRFVESKTTKSLDMAIQSRIVQNLQLEARIAENARLAEKPEKPEKAPRAPRAPRAASTGEKKALGREFTGMRPEDFTGTVTGTTWRNKDSLAGGVRARLQKHFKKQFKSTPVSNAPAVFMTHQETGEAACIARFVLRADQDGFHYGLLLERVNEQCADFERFVRKLREDDTLRQFATQLEKGGLRVEGRRSVSGTSEPLWEAGSSWDARLAALEAPYSGGESREISLLRLVPVQEAVDKGTDLVDEVAKALTEQLAPFYSAAAL